MILRKFPGIFGFCLWETGAAKWMAVNWLVLFQASPPIVFILGMAFFVMMMTNFIMNVAAIAISLPVALVIAPYLGVGGEVILFSALVVAGMPFLLLVGALFMGSPGKWCAHAGHLACGCCYLADDGHGDFCTSSAIKYTA